MYLFHKILGTMANSVGLDQTAPLEALNSSFGGLIWVCAVCIIMPNLEQLPNTLKVNKSFTVGNAPYLGLWLVSCTVSIGSERL